MHPRERAVPVIELDRGQFLRMGAAGVAGLTAAGLVPAAASAQTQAPAPQDDDIAFLSFATVAERTCRDFYRAAHQQKGTGLSASERRHIDRIASAKRSHVLRLNTALGADAPLSGDFETVLPKGAVDTRTRILTLAEQLETLLVGVYLNGVGYAEDAGTRLVLGRLLTYDAQQIAWLRGAAGTFTPAGLPGPIDLEAAADRLDAFLSTPDFQE
jgi:hypothetical protein